MAPKVTSSSNRSGRKPAKPRPITTSKGRGNRANVSSARVTNDTTRPPNGSGGARVTNANNRGVDASTARVTGGTPASPPLTRRSRVNGRVVAGTDTRGNRPAQPAKPAAQPAKPPVKPPVKPSGTFKAPDIPKPATSGRLGELMRDATTGRRGPIGASSGLGMAAEGALYAAGSSLIDAFGKGLNRAIRTERAVRMSSDGGRYVPGDQQRPTPAQAPKPAAKPKPPTRSSGGNPPAPGSSRRQPSSGGGSSAPSRPVSTSPSRPSSPQTSSGTAGKGRSWDEFNPNRGTSKSNNPLLDREGGYLRERMKAREDAANKKFDTKSDVYTPNTKVDGSGLDTKKLKKRRFGTDS